MQEKDAQIIMEDSPKYLANGTTEYKDAMENLTSINLTLSQNLDQAQEAILALYKQMHAIQTHMNNKKTTTEKPVTDNNKRYNKSKNCFCTHGRTHNHYHTRQTCCRNILSIDS